ncbi:hypothetical protein Acr_18g0007000 [Actinidia rufa]|uniref:Protein FAR1-RELATED SEQUENCE n=1 Tax=Actinidia rufa TaxID=165716 RepID=A0A7J0G6W0_9ERIC|nr:hypothetical protein Acr_18g0007000 [Actinidia rufa]
MDNYLGSFSDSWSFENDVPIGESISNNSHDYTAEFTTDQCVMKKCAPMLGLEWKRFYASWHSLINSSTQWSYQQKWEVMHEEYRRFDGVLKYLEETWLHHYKERFVSAWVDTCMHLGSNSSQRAESAHARLKLYLGDTMSSLQTSFEKIHKMLIVQLGDIKKSFERSINIPRHKHLHDDIFSQVRCQISLEAMKLISSQLQCVEEASHQLAGKCNCSIKIVYALPCEHDLAHYRYFSIPIPLQSIDAHWRRLSMHVHEFKDEGVRPNRTSHVVEILDGMDPQMREHMIDRVTKPTSRSRGRGRHGKGLGVRSPPIHDTYIEKLPVALQRYISHTVDVQPDGHCGFRAIAALIGYGEEGWAQVRFDLMEEIQQNKYLYDQLYPDRNLVANLLFSLNWFEPWAPEMYWMDSMPLGIVIASRYNLVLHTFGEHVGSCFTHLPLRTPPIPNQ